MLNFVFCDDNRLQIEILEEFFKEFNRQHKEKIRTRHYFSGERLLSNVKNVNEVDVFILDLIMPGLNGIQVAERLRARGYKGKLVFLTATMDFVLDAFSVQAYDYVLKPVDFPTLTMKVEKVQRELEEAPEHKVIVHTKEGKRSVLLRDVLFIHLEGRTPFYRLTDGTEIEGGPGRSSFREMVADFLESGIFALCGAGVAVNLTHVRSFLNATVIFDDESELVCTRSKVQSFRDALRKHWSA